MVSASTNVPQLRPVAQPHHAENGTYMTDVTTGARVTADCSVRAIVQLCLAL